MTHSRLTSEAVPVGAAGSGITRAAELVAAARAAGLTLTPAGGPQGTGLAVSPGDDLSDELRAQLVAHKAEVLALLRAEAEPDRSASRPRELGAAAAFGNPEGSP